jgi:hypothetical protein
VRNSLYGRVTSWMGAGLLDVKSGFILFIKSYQFCIHNKHAWERERERRRFNPLSRYLMLEITLSIESWRLLNNSKRNLLLCVMDFIMTCRINVIPPGALTVTQLRRKFCAKNSKEFLTRRWVLFEFLAQTAYCVLSLINFQYQQEATTDEICNACEEGRKTNFEVALRSYQFHSKTTFL